MNYDKRNYIQLSGELFNAVQSERLFNDSKTFVDSVPIKDPAAILEEYQSVKSNSDFNLKDFIMNNFTLPQESSAEDIVISHKENMADHILMLWDLLVRKSGINLSPYSTLIPLPDDYLIPGGRFREVYYWDSYFTMLGLFTAGRYELIKKTVNNFSWLLDTIGFIPNGNRIYYLTRSQPPFFPLMINLLDRIKPGQKSGVRYINQIEKEYKYWMRFDDNELLLHGKHRHVVSLSGNVLLNRYYDTDNMPREESFFEDKELKQKSKSIYKRSMFCDIRAAAESGWDFSGRWFEDGENLTTIETAEIVPVDLNCLIGYCEFILSDFYNRKGNGSDSAYYKEKFERRLNLIRTLFWDEEKGLFFDYKLRSSGLSWYYTLAAMYPLFFGFADKHQAEKVAENVERLFLKDGGVVTSFNKTAQQWDAPNGWPPLQWITIVGLRNYGYDRLADIIKERWLKLNESVFSQTGRMFEKYNVENIHIPGGGGEYPLQDGFGWTNGVASALLNNLDFDFTTKPF